MWPDTDQAQSCTRCRAEKHRSRQVVVTANMKYSGTRFKMPVAYCELHDIIGTDEGEEE